MIIGIDASKAAVKKRTGVENYTYQLILGLKKIDHQNVYYLYTNAPLPEEFSHQVNMFEKRCCLKRFFNKISLPFLLMRTRPDVYLQPLYKIPRSAPDRSITVIHDLAWLKFPEAYSRSERASQLSALENALKYAKKIICVSDSTKDDLIKSFSEAKHKAVTINPSYSEGTFKPISHPKDPLKIDSPYFLFAGRLEERKNIVRIINSFIALKLAEDIPHKLVLAGSPGYGYQKIKQTIAQLDKNLQKFIILPGYIKNEDMPDLMSGAEAFVYPSLYEGFGIAVLDAMAAGTPVITSNTSSLPEIAGEAALLVDPLDEKDITAAMKEILIKKDVKNRLINKGLEQIQKYSWEKSARAVLDLLETL
jgi:glycosyltransferase involved in cell wall biosynthesis